MYDRSFPETEKAPLRTLPSAAAQGVYVERLVLTRFRNYDALTFDIPEKTGQVVLTGPNGSGKTNLTEAVSLLTAGRGLRNARLSDFAKKDCATFNTRWAVAAHIRRANTVYAVGTGRTDTQTDKRTVRVDEETKPQTELARLFPMIWLTPSMDRLFSGDPAARRRFLDRLAHCFDPKHAGHCIAYARALKQWHFLVRDGATDTSWLTALETTLAEYGAKISKTRTETVQRLKNVLESQPSGVFPETILSLENVPASEQLANLFSQARHMQTAPAGVHQTDFKALNADKNMTAALCSTGEQKAMLAAVLTAHLKAQAAETGTLPLMLLDEAAAHLDPKRLEAFLGYLSNLKTQVWLTGTAAEAFSVLTGTAVFRTVSELFDQRPATNAAAS